jgi:LysM repeat protein
VIGSWTPIQAPILRRQVWLLIAAVGVVVVLAAPSGSSTRSSTRAGRVKAGVSSTTTTTAGPITYQVKRGDNLTALARFFGLSPSGLATFNHLSDADQLTVGQMLQIPRRPPIKLVVTPPDGSPGETFTFNLTGAEAGETVTFEVDAPGYKFTGPPHTAADDGSVSTSYQTNASGASGTYTVAATGDQGTSVRATLRVDASSPIS